MDNKTKSDSAQILIEGLEIIELEERLEMVHLSAVEAEASNRCDTGSEPGDCVEIEMPEITHN